MNVVEQLLSGEYVQQIRSYVKNGSVLWWQKDVDWEEQEDVLRLPDQVSQQQRLGLRSLAMEFINFHVTQCLLLNSFTHDQINSIRKKICGSFKIKDQNNTQDKISKFMETLALHVLLGGVPGGHKYMSENITSLLQDEDKRSSDDSEEEEEEENRVPEKDNGSSNNNNDPTEDYFKIRQENVKFLFERFDASCLDKNEFRSIQKTLDYKFYFPSLCRCAFAQHEIVGKDLHEKDVYLLIQLGDAVVKFVLALNQWHPNLHGDDAETESEDTYLLFIFTRFGLNQKLPKLFESNPKSCIDLIRALAGAVYLDSGMSLDKVCQLLQPKKSPAYGGLSYVFRMMVVVVGMVAVLASIFAVKR